MSEAALPPLLATLFERLEGPEALEIEYKSAKGGLPRSIWETVSAFANTQGGWILLGVAETDNRAVVEGVADAAKLLKQFHDLLRNPNKISYPVCTAQDARTEELGGKQIGVIRVPASPRKARPIYINGNPYLGTYVRRQSGDYRCTKPEVDRMMREASDISADSAVLPHFSVDDLDPEALSGYRRHYQTLNTASPWNSYDDLRFVEAIGGYRKDRESGESAITVAGLLMLGRPEAIRDWRSRHLIDYRLLPEEDRPETRWDDRIAWEGNLFGAFQGIYPQIVMGERTPFQLRLGARIDEGPAHVALREAFVNLLVHADYTETAASLVLRSPEGYVFRNPGSSRVSEYDLLTGDRSDPRNPELVRMFRFIGLAEEAGTGMPKIIRAWRDLGFQLPAVDVGTERYEFSLRLRHAHLISSDDRKWLASLGDNWQEAEQLAMVITRHEGEVNNLRLRTVTGQHPADATKVLRSLRDRELLQMIGGKRSARYELGPAAGTGDNGLGSGGSEPSSGGNGLSSGSKEPDSGDKAFETPELWSELQALAAVARQRRRLDVATLEGTIVSLCAIASLSLRELAGLLHRGEDRLRPVMRGLIAAGRLTYLYPGKVTHPGQKYVAASTDTTKAQ